MSTTAAASRLAEDWLPLVRQPTSLGSKVLHQSDLEENQHRDWYFSFAVALFSEDPLQSRMLAKAYLFLRDFVPQGLTGRFSHIGGGDVMDQLLCHKPETTASRHRVTKSADSAFNKLGLWMGTHKSWQSALRRAKKDADAEKRSTGKKRLGGKAPGLHSPAALLAVLIISHPDPESKFRKWIGRMGIDWMIRPRETLEVRHGFWKGLNKNNLDMIFATEAEEQRKAETETLADYDRLFGQDFLASRRDIRPFLPQQWAARLVPLIETPSDMEDDGPDADQETARGGGKDNINGAGNQSGDEAGEHDSDAPVAGEDDGTGADDVADDDAGEHIAGDGHVEDDGAHAPDDITSEGAPSLRELLGASEAGSHDIQQWLLRRLVDDKITSAWCTSWEGKIKEVDNYQDQMLVRSLFLHSVRWLHSLVTSPHPAGPQLAHGFMLVDMADSEAIQVQDKLVAFLRKNALFTAYNTEEHQLESLVHRSASQPVQRHLGRLYSELAAFFCHFSQYSPFHTHGPDIAAFETLYTQAIIQGHEDPFIGRADLDFLRDQKEALLSETTVKTLRLRRWQIRALLLPGSFRALTDWQLHIFARSSRDGGKKVDLSELRPMPVTVTVTYPDAVQLHHPALRKLLGEVKPPSFDASLPSSCLAAPDPRASQELPPVEATATPAPAEPTSGRPGVSLMAPHQPIIKQDASSSLNTSEHLLVDNDASLISNSPVSTSPASTALTSLCSDTHVLPHQRQETGSRHPLSVTSTALHLQTNSPNPFRRTPSQAALSSRNSSPSCGAGSVGPNPFSGQSRVLDKRRLSPYSEARPPKIARLGGGVVTRDDLSDELSVFRAELKSDVERLGQKTDTTAAVAEVGHIITTAKGELKAEIITSMMVNLETQMQELQNAFRRDTEVDGAPIRDTLAELMATTRRQKDDLSKLAEAMSSQKDDVLDEFKKHKDSILSSMNAQNDALITSINSQKSSMLKEIRKQKDDMLEEVKRQKDSILASLDIQGIIQEALKQQHEVFIASQEKAPPGPGHDGYLAQCVAPAGWAQHDYESALIRAAGLYIHVLGDRDGGVWADEHTFDVVSRTFPALDHDHIVMALDDAHMRAYRCLLPRKN